MSEPAPLKPRQPKAIRRNVAPIHMHRGYRCVRSGAGYNVKHMLVKLFPHLPTRFLWTSRDELGLHAYIDALYRRDHEVAADVERQGRAVELEYAPASSEREPHLEVSIRRLVECLSLTDRCNVPLWGEVAFVTDGHTLVPKALVAELARLAPEAFSHLDPEAPWHTATESDLKQMGLTPEQVTSGMYRGAAAPVAGNPAAGEAQGPAPPAPPPRERTIRRRDHGEWIDWLTETQPDVGQRWYTRRIYVPGGVTLYAATAWTPNGPWTVYERNVSAQLALGLDV